MGDTPTKTDEKYNNKSIIKNPETQNVLTTKKKDINESIFISPEIQKVLRPYLNKLLRDTLISDRYYLAYYNKHLSNAYPFRDTSVCDFLTLVAYGQEKAVENLLKEYPQLLLETGIITDYSGRIIKGTAYQIALGAEDIEMCKMLDKYFAILKNNENELIGEEEKKKQFNAQFPPELYPNGIENTPSDYDFSALVTEITNDNFTNDLPNDETQAAINKFRVDFTPKRENVITTGKHFNMQHLDEAYGIYNQHYDAWNYQQCSLFWRQVIGYLQRFVPACYAQAFCQGLFNLYEKKPLERKFNLKDGEVYFPLDVDSSSGLGWDFGVYCALRSAETDPAVGKRGWTGPGACLARPRREPGGLRYYIEQKHQILENLKHTSTQTTSSVPKTQATNRK